MILRVFQYCLQFESSVLTSFPFLISQFTEHGILDYFNYRREWKQNFVIGFEQLCACSSRSYAVLWLCFACVSMGQCLVPYVWQQRNQSLNKLSDPIFWHLAVKVLLKLYHKYNIAVLCITAN